MFSKNTVTGVIGSGAMGSGIAQVAAMAGHNVLIYDNNSVALDKAKSSLERTLQKLQEKGKLASAEDVLGRMQFINELTALKSCG